MCSIVEKNKLTDFFATATSPTYVFKFRKKNIVFNIENEFLAE